MHADLQRPKLGSRSPQSCVASILKSRMNMKASTCTQRSRHLPTHQHPAHLHRSSRRPASETTSRSYSNRTAAAAASPVVSSRVSPRTTDDGTLSSLMDKFRTVFKIFFPEKPKPLTAKEIGRQRLQMILVADRCGLSPAALIEMKRNTFKALQGSLELEDIEEAEMRFTVTREGGTTYTMAVPVYKAGCDLLEQQQGSAAAAAGADDDDDEYDDYEEDEEEGDIVDVEASSGGEGAGGRQQVAGDEAQGLLMVGEQHLGDEGAEGHGDRRR